MRFRWSHPWRDPSICRRASSALLSNGVGAKSLHSSIHSGLKSKARVRYLALDEFELDF
jgi:hypothetical protein